METTRTGVVIFIFCPRLLCIQYSANGLHETRSNLYKLSRVLLPRPQQWMLKPYPAQWYHYQTNLCLNSSQIYLMLVVNMHVFIYHADTTKFN